MEPTNNNQVDRGSSRSLLPTTYKVLTNVKCGSAEWQYLMMIFRIHYCIIFACRG